jgi:cephalosporin-C deacetylase
MPLIDMPLPQLLEYQGRNPRPSDFDAYWSQAIAELDATPPNPQFTPATFSVPNAECFDLTFTGVGNARIYAKFLRPKNRQGKIPGICQFHGYSGHSGDWLDKLAYVQCGFAIASMDCRGQGGKSQDPASVAGNTLNGHIIRGIDDPDPRKLLFRQIYLDTAQLARVMMSLPEVDASHVSAIGGSQGGGLTLACASLTPTLRKAAPIFPFLCDYQRVWEMDLAKDAYSELRSHFRSFDPTHAREKEIFTKLGYIDCQHLAPRIRAEMHFGIGLMDTICPPSTQFAAYNKITAKKSYTLYPDYGHENLPGFPDKVVQWLLS